MLKNNTPSVFQILLSEVSQVSILDQTLFNIFLCPCATHLHITRATTKLTAGRTINKLIF